MSLAIHGHETSQTEIDARRNRAGLRAKIRMAEVCAEMRPKRERAQWLANAEALRRALAEAEAVQS